MVEEQEKPSLSNFSFKNILAIEDDSGIISTLSYFFTTSGYNVTRVSSIDDAISKLNSEDFDFIFVNALDREINGNKLILKIRKFNKKVCILFFTDKKNYGIPLDTFRLLDIQNFFDIDNKFDNFLSLAEIYTQSITLPKNISKINIEISVTYDMLEESYLEGIKDLDFSTITDYTRGHSFRVSEYSVLLGKYEKLPYKSLFTLRVGGLFHDIGKIGIIEDILQKNTKLTDEEFEEVKNHPVIGASILEASTIFTDIIPIVRNHHERYDGRGYPDKLQGEEISYLARITAIADSFDAMTSRRSYRDPLDIEIVKNEFRKNKGTQFDPELTDVFIDILENHYDEILYIQNKY